MKKIYALMIVLFSMQFAGYAQSGLGTIRGVVKDTKTKKAVDYATIVLFLNGIQKATAQTDDDGAFIIKTLQPGEYTLKAIYAGYGNVEIDKIEVVADEDRYVNFTMSNTTLDVVVIKYEKQLVDPKGVNGGNVGSKEILNRGSRNINTIAGTTMGVETRANGTPNIRGARADGTAYYIDGVRVQAGATNIPTNAIDNIQIITGGTPARYGDFVGGAISITTKAPTRNFIRTFELQTASPFYGYLDYSHYNQFQTVLSGPIKIINKGRGNEERVLLGFLVSGSFTYAKDGRPPAVDVYKVKNDKLKQIQNTPLIPGGNGTLFPASEYLTKNDLEKINYRQNVATYNVDLNGNFNFQPSFNTNVRLGYYGNFNQGRNYNSYQSLLNPENNSFSRGYTVRTYLQFTQTFKKEPVDKDKKETAKAESNITNAYYSVRFSYERGFAENMDAEHQKNIFDYGYIGKFKTYQAPFYARTVKSIDQKPDSFLVKDGKYIYLTDYQRQIAFVDTAYTFEQDKNYNQVRGNYTRAVYDFLGQSNIRTLGNVRERGGLINGDNPNGIYSLMWANVGSNQAGYSKSLNEAFNLYVMSEFTIASKSNPKARHEIEIGINVEQQFRRGYFVDAQNLWGLMRLLANRQFSGLKDSSQYGILKFDANGVFQDTVSFQRRIIPGVQSNFDKNFRDKLISQGALDVYGKPIDSTSFIDVNSYKPGDYTLGMLNADELLNGGNSRVSYSGYDHLGNVVRKKSSIDDFLNNPATRALPAYQPVYMAAWLQDKFVFKDLIVRVGVRVERFDANQPVLKDPYSIVPIYTVGEVKKNSSFENLKKQIPSNIGDNFAVYVNKDADQQTSDQSNAQIAGYRDGNNWFDKNGNPISDPQQIARNAKTNRNIPLLVDPKNSNLPKSSSFTDYIPDVKVLPRIWFSFPINTTSQFFGTYDILTQRPNTNIGQIDDYYYLQNRLSQGAINNPNLKMTQVTDYEIGFRQQIGRDAALEIIASYREFRNMIQLYRYVQAWPNDYSTYGNLDFATVKSLGVKYEIRDLGNITLNANYQLQFADGTGSNSTSSNALIQVGLPTLRTIFPLDFDTRHTFKAVFDYHYKEGAKDYTGPMVNGKRILENAGINFVLTSYSGRPYTQNLNPTPDAQSGVVVRSPVKGTINGANLPSQVNVDMNIDKVFLIKKKKIDGATVGYGFRIFASVQNLFNTSNVTSVFRYTGSGYNDGFIASPAAKEQINTATNQQSYVDLYNIRMINPDRFSFPRLVRLGMSLSF
ncbi:MAG: TonB-dependent receptor [Bacteroidia bacterium]|nr:TonB-dependent receptor [Bacteroidia bacterium]